MTRAVVLVLLAACTPRPVYLLEPPARTPPGSGYPMHVPVPHWTRPAITCRVARKPLPPEYDGAHWVCPSELRQ